MVMNLNEKSSLPEAAGSSLSSQLYMEQQLRTKTARDKNLCESRIQNYIRII